MNQEEYEKRKELIDNLLLKALHYIEKVQPTFGNKYNNVTELRACLEGLYWQAKISLIELNSPSEVSYYTDLAQKEMYRRDEIREEGNASDSDNKPEYKYEFVDAGRPNDAKK